MARKKQALPAIATDARAEVEALLHQRELAPRVRERLEMVKGIALGQDLQTVASWVGRSERTVRQWVARFAAGGPAALADAPREGRPPRATAAYQQLMETVVETPPRALGLPFDVWTSARLSAYLAQETGVRIAPGWVRVLLGRRDFVCGRPKHTLKHLQDPEEVAACRQELAAAERKSGGRARAL
jgi:transposase